jgi:hypothetical protein
MMDVLVGVLAFVMVLGPALVATFHSSKSPKT